jgi:addiction module HigA family antidote
MSDPKPASDVLSAVLASLKLTDRSARMLDAAALRSLARSTKLRAGEVLVALMQAHQVKAERLAEQIGIDAMQVSRLRRSKIPVTRRNAALLGRFFGTGARFWLELQVDDDLVAIEEDSALKEKLDSIKPITERSSND